jgi:DNA-binding CsgD family transcriptional regulator
MAYDDVTAVTPPSARAPRRPELPFPDHATTRCVPALLVDGADRSPTTAGPGTARSAGRPVAMEQMALLAALNIAAVLLDAQGLVRHVSPIARPVLGEDIRVHNRRLLALDHASNDALRSLVCSAVTVTPAGQARDVSTVVVVRREKRPLLVSVLISTGSHAPAVEDYAIIVFTDPDLRPQPDMAVMCRAFGLTSAEARLARLLATGESLDGAATHFGITRGTASQHLKSIFAKTETHRQAELVSLLARLTPPGAETAAG